MIGIGIIGFGYWGPNLARVFAATPGCRLVAIADASGPALEHAGARHPAVRLETDWRALLTAPDIDAVVIATPVSTHYAMASAALAAGRHVLVEKPMTDDVRQAEALVTQAQRCGRVLMVDHTFVYTPAVRKMRAMIDAGEIGDVYYYHSTRINLGLFQSDVNVVWDLAAHDAAILGHLLDTPPAAVSANGVSHLPNRPENMAHITLFFDGPGMAQISVNWLAPVKVRQTLIGGSRRMIVYDDLEPSEKVKVYDRGVSCETPQGDGDLHRMLISYRVGDMWAPHLPIEEALAVEAAHFVDCVANGRTPITDGHAGLRVVAILDAACRSMRRRGQPIELAPLKAAS